MDRSEAPTPDPVNTNAAMLAHPPSLPQQQPKRYRAPPAKTFQCRGYGDCAMIFSRSEHLARHIRKHTGERPFTCHCGKQFSRLDNLRQHAQTVHADKPEQNERMMRDLTSLHASMAAANKIGQARGGRRPAAAAAASVAVNINTNASAAAQAQTAQAQAAAVAAAQAAGLSTHALAVNGLGMIKQEDVPMTMHPHPRSDPGVPYDPEHHHNGLLYHHHHQNGWHVQAAPDHAADAHARSHSFRDPGQSFLAPASHNNNNATAAAAAQPPPPPPPPAGAQSQSFLSFAPTLGFGLSTDPRDAAPRSRSGSGASRPSTAAGLADPNNPRSLPPLSAIVSSSIPASSSPVHQQQQQQPYSTPSPASAQSQQLLAFPPHHLHRRQPTASRPGTASSTTGASASFYSAKSSPYHAGPGMVPRPAAAELSPVHYGRFDMGHPGQQQQYDTSPPAAAAVPDSPSGADPSPFYFSPPEHPHQHASASPPLINVSSSSNPRKRAYAGPDGPHAYDEFAYGASPPPPPRHGQQQQHNHHHQQQQSHDAAQYHAAPQQHHPYDYDYGSESRPQSRRLSVMELCNDSDAGVVGNAGVHVGSGAFLLSAAAAAAASSSAEYGYAGVYASTAGSGSSRPGTSTSGLVSSASALALFDRESSGTPPRAAGHHQHQQQQYQHVYGHASQPHQATVGGGSPVHARASPATDASGGRSPTQEFGRPGAGSGSSDGGVFGYGVAPSPALSANARLSSATPPSATATAAAAGGLSSPTASVYDARRGSASASPASAGAVAASPLLLGSVHHGGHSPASYGHGGVPHSPAFSVISDGGFQHQHQQQHFVPSPSPPNVSAVSPHLQQQHQHQQQRAASFSPRSAASSPSSVVGGGGSPYLGGPHAHHHAAEYGMRV